MRRQGVPSHVEHALSRSCGLILALATCSRAGPAPTRQRRQRHAWSWNGSTTAWNFAAVGRGVWSGGTIEFVCPPQYCDAYTLNVVLPSPDSTFYTNHIATLKLTYTWNSTGPDDMDVFAFAPTVPKAGQALPTTPAPAPAGSPRDLQPQSGPWTIESYVGVSDEPTAATRWRS